MPLIRRPFTDVDVKASFFSAPLHIRRDLTFIFRLECNFQERDLTGRIVC